MEVSDHIGYLEKLSKADIDQLSQDRDHFLNTARIDTAPVTWNEAAAMGLAMVSTDVGGIRRLFADGREI